MLVYDAATVSKMLKAMGDVIAYDTETVGVAPPGTVVRGKDDALILDRARMIVFSAAGHDKDGEEISFCVFCAEHFGKRHVHRDHLIEAIRPFMEDKRILKVAQNANYDANVMNNHGIKVQNQECTLIKGRCWNENIAGSLKDRAPLVGIMLKKTRMIDFTAESATMAAYAEQDAVACLRLWYYYEELEDFFPENRRLYKELETPIMEVVQKAEQTGIPIDTKKVEGLYQDALKKKGELVKAIYRECGITFNLASPAQLAEVLYVKLRLPAPKKKSEASKHPPTDEKSLFPLAQNKAVSLIMDYRHTSKLIETYLSPTKGIRSYLDDKGVVHPTLQQSGAKTSRFSSSSPKQHWAFAW